VFYSFQNKNKEDNQSNLKFEELDRKVEPISQNNETLEFKIVLKKFNLFLNLHVESESAILTLKDKDILTDFNFTYNTDLESALEEIKVLKPSSSNDIIVILPITTEEFLTFQLILFESQHNKFREGLFEINTHKFKNVRNYYLENKVELTQYNDSFEIILGDFKYKGEFTEFKK
jgi:hypothetical protein